MALVPDPQKKGLWRSDAGRLAGAHALVIGISDYPYLAEGSAPLSQRAPDNGGLGQLEVCARTAARVFEWLTKSGEVAGAPLATVRLLLAPHPLERANVDALTGGHYESADFASVRSAIDAWGESIFAGGTAAEPNVAFFFFSGHGTEYMSSPALLASDILNPASPGAARKAISFPSLCAVKTFGIDRALFFVDACRDVPAVARKMNMTGATILDPYPFPPRTHDALLCLQSTSAGGTSFQVPGDSATIFGRAVLEALEGPPPSHRPYDTTSSPWRLLFAKLEDYVKRRVSELLAAESATRVQHVVPFGDPYNADMLVAKKLVPRFMGSKSNFREPVSLDAAIEKRASDLLRNFSPAVSGHALLAPGDGGINELKDHSSMRRIFRHESITQLWTSSLQIFDATTELPIAPDSVAFLQGRSAEVEKSLTAWVDVRVNPENSGAVWVQAGGDPSSTRDETSYAVVLPRDAGHPIVVRLDVSFDLSSPHGGRIIGMSARLGDPGLSTAYLPSAWRELWRAQRIETFFDLGRASRVAGELVQTERALERKLESPIAATIATTVLLRGGALEQVHDLPRNLAEWFKSPDGAVLWAETLIRRDARARSGTGQDESVSRDFRSVVASLMQRHDMIMASEYFSKLADWGPPLLAPSLAMAANQTLFWRRVLEAGVVGNRQFRDLQDACALVEMAAEYAVPGGLFAGFAGPSKVLSPRKILGSRATSRKTESLQTPKQAGAAG
jgi:Caspase domain